MSVTPQAFHFHLNKLTDTDKYLIAYSGGVDSHVLLHLCSQLKNSPSGFARSFSAVYIDHGLSYNSTKWGKHCQHVCYELDIPLTIIEVDASPKKGQSPEAAARTARYHAFSQLLKHNECLLTAQHQDDQAETLLLQLLRGSGTRGLSAMPRIKPFAKGNLCRPMLDYKKQEILAYASLHKLQWIEDESNEEQRYDRNFLRHEIIPRLELRWPAVQENLAKSAEVLAESQVLLDELAIKGSQNLYSLNEQGEKEYDKLLLSPLKALLSYADNELDKNLPYHCQHHELARLNNILRHWINLNQLPLPSKKILEQIVQSVILSRDDAKPLVCWKRDGFHCEVRRFRNKIYLIHTTRQSKTDDEAWLKQTYELNIASDIDLQGDKVKLMSANTLNVKRGFEREALLERPLQLRFRRGGERFRKMQGGQSYQLKHWFQEQNVPPWERNRLPLIYWGEELIQVGNTIVNHSLLTDDVNNSLIIRWIRQDMDEIIAKKR